MEVKRVVFIHSFIHSSKTKINSRNINIWKSSEKIQTSLTIMMPQSMALWAHSDISHSAAVTSASRQMSTLSRLVSSITIVGNMSQSTTACLYIEIFVSPSQQYCLMIIKLNMWHFQHMRHFKIIRIDLFCRDTSRKKFDRVHLNAGVLELTVKEVKAPHCLHIYNFNYRTHHTHTYIIF